MWMRRKPLIKKRTFLMEQLEERVVFDASVVGADAQHDQADNWAFDPGQDAVLGNSTVPGGGEANDAAKDSALAETPASTQPEQIITDTTLDGSVISADGESGTGQDLISGSDDAAETTADDPGYGTPVDDSTESSSIVSINPEDLSLVSSGTRILVVDSTLTNADDLVAATREGVTSVLYDGTSETLQGLLDTIRTAAGSGPAAGIAFATHNSGTGGFDLTGDYSVTSETLSSNPDLQSFWMQVGSLLAEDGRIDLMACDVAATETGELLVAQLEALTGRNVAASDDDTGNPISGGDWILETDDVDLAAGYFDASLITQFEGRLGTIDLTGKDGWTTVMTGSAFDPTHDQQAQKATTDLVGDATHGVLYMAYDDKGTAVDTDDEIAFRVRIGGSDSGGSFSSVILLGIDADLDWDMDLFLTIEDSSDGTQLYNPESGYACDRPSTTRVTDGGRDTPLLGNYDFSPVSEDNDPNWNGNIDIGSYNGNDYFVTVKLKFSEIRAEFAEFGYAITKDSPLNYVLGTSTQENAYNSDMGGYDGKTQWDVSFAEKFGGLPPVSPSGNFVPQITSDGGGDTADVTAVSGNRSVTTVTAHDQDDDWLTFSITGGDDASLFTIDAVSGILTFINAPKWDQPLDADRNSEYVVEVTVDDGRGGTDIQELTVVVENPNGDAPPTLVSANPADGGTADNKSPAVVYTFDEPIKVNAVDNNGDLVNDPISVEIGPSSYTFAYDDPRVIVAGYKLILDIGDLINGNKAMEIIIPEGFVTDLEGNAYEDFLIDFDGGTLTDVHDFQSSNAKPPATVLLVGNTPADGAVGVDATSDIVLQFDQNVIPDNDPTTGTSGDFHLWRYDTGTSAWVKVTDIDAQDGTQAAYAGVNVTLDPVNDLLPGTQYAVTVDANAVQNYGGTNYGGHTAYNVVYFTTAGTADTDGPTVTGVTSLNADGTWTDGQTIYVVVNFSETVYVDLTGGSPTLTLDTGDPDGTAVYMYGSGTGSLTFKYLIDSDDTAADLNYVSTDSLVLNGATIKDYSGNVLEPYASQSAGQYLPPTTAAASLAGEGVGSGKDLVIDLAPVNNFLSVERTASVEEGSSLALNTVFDTGAPDPAHAVTDKDLGTNNLTVTLSVLHGTLNTTVGASPSVEGKGTSELTIVGDEAFVNSVISAATYTPDPGYSGTDSLQIVSWDGENRASDNRPVQDVDTVDITVTGVDSDTPMANDDGPYNGYENTLFAGNVSENDSPGTDGATYTIVTAPVSGTLWFSGTTGAFHYTPGTDVTGEMTFEYQIIDDLGEPSNTATVTFNIADGPAKVTVSANDPSASEQGSNPGQFTVDLGEYNNTNGEVIVTYSVGGTATGTADEDYTALSGSVKIPQGQRYAVIDVTGIVDDSDIEGNETVIVALTDARNDEASPVVFDVDTTAATVTIADNDNAGNQDPVGSDDGGSITEPTSTYTTGVLISDAETPPASLTVTIPPGQSTTGTLTYNNDGTFTYTYTGGELSDSDVVNESFSYTVEDADGGTDTGTITVTVTGDNDDPVA
ncbi:MAG: DUF4347 domain-containing protein, partial [Pseudomonadota bacterium]